MIHGPAISVVLPYFNAEHTLEVAIQSTLEQSFTDFELILVDNGSTDHSATIAHRLAANDHRITLTQEPTRGVSFASNTGFRLAKAPLIARMDADDRMLPTRLKKQHDFMRQHPHIGLIGGQVQYIGDETHEGFRHYVDWSNRLDSSEQLLLNRFVELPIVNPTILLRKSLFDQLGGYHHGDFPEDYEMILRWMAEGVEMGKVSAPVLEWHDVPNRLTRTDPRYATDAFFQTKAHYLAAWLKKEVPLKDLWIGGAGKLGRRRSDMLKTHGIHVTGYIDVRPRQLPLPCIHFSDIPEPGRIFILSYVSNRGKREEVRHYLVSKGYVEGLDFLLAA